MKQSWERASHDFYLLSIFVIFAALIAETGISHAAMRTLEKRIERIERQMKY